MPKSTYLANVALNAFLRGTTYVPPGPNVYVALYTTAPTVSGGGTEVAGGSYVRQPVTFNSPSLGIIASSADVSFPIATLAYGTIVAFAFLDAGTGGNLLYFSPLSSPRAVLLNDQVVFSAGQLIASES